MSIKKGKKQVYKVKIGDRVKVIVCAGGNPSHLGKTGTYKGTTFDETYPVIEIGKDDFCNPKKLSTLKPKKSIKKMYKSKDIEKLFKPIKLREFLKEKALEKEQTEQAKAIKELLKRVRVLEDNQREPNSFMSLQFLTCKRCGGEIKGAHYC